MAFTALDLNIPTLEARFWAKVDKRSPDECWPWTAATNAGGYGVIGLSHDRTGLATHVSLGLAGKPREGDAHACHTCDNPPCVNPVHLWWGTLADNNRDMHAKGRWVNNIPKGIAQKGAKLTEDAVREIRSSPLNNVELGAKFGVSATLIWKVRNRDLWRHI